MRFIPWPTRPATALSPPSSQQPAVPTRHGAHGVAGTITAENGTSWTVTTAKGKQVSVNITPQTTFRARHNTATAQQFPVGAKVRVTGTRQGSTVTATKIVLRPARPPVTAPPVAV